MQNFSDQFLQYWAQFSAQTELGNHQSQQLSQLLLKAYTEPQRYYHTVQHIVECLGLFHQVKGQLHDPVAVELAIWFHDVVYDPEASDNEERSAKLMQKHCAGIVEKEKLEKVYQWIVATKAHQPSEDHDLNYLLDMDLAILGSAAPRFAEYERQIQQEYTWVEPELYKVKRAEVLQYFYQMRPLYQTEYFQILLEQTAKSNLSQAVW